MSPVEVAWLQLEVALRDKSSSVNYLRHQYGKLLRATLKECVELSHKANDIRIN